MIDAGSGGPGRVLVADDQPDILAALRLLLKAEGIRTVAVDSPGAVLEALGRDRFDLVLIDLNYTRDTTSGQEGLELLSRIQQAVNPPTVVVMTAWGSIELAVEAMRRGARDFVIKPWENEKLLTTLRRHLGDSRQPEPPSSGDDLAIARRVQNKLLPQSLPELGTLDYAAHCHQAGAVGGDYYDFLDLGGGRVLFVLADVSGKGVPAALLMANLQASLRTRCREDWGNDLPALAGAVNRLFFDNTEPEHFATAFLGVYDDGARTLDYVNCGHNSPLLIRSGSDAERLDATATVLGAFPFFRSTARATTIGSGDMLAVFSDGVSEARDAGDEQFGDTRLVDALRRHATTPVTEVPERLTEAVTRFSAYGQEDDLTLIVARGR